MKTILRIALALVLVAAVLGANSAQKPGIEAAAWLAGRWEFEKNGRIVREEWMAPAGGTMLGMSRTVKGDKTLEYEHLFLGADEQGDLTYVSIPSGQTKTAFKLLKHEGHSIVFENKEHDFPQRVGYTLNSDGSLTAFIEGEVNGKLRRVVFPYRRVN